MNSVKHIGLALLVSCVAGCGGDDGPKVYSVTGKVTIDGKAAPNLRVQFVGETDGTGTTGDDGSFTVTSGTADGKEGLAPGTYKVYLQAVADDSQSKGYSGDPTKAPDAPFPKKWGSPSTTPKSAEIKAEDNVVNIEVKSE